MPRLWVPGPEVCVASRFPSEWRTVDYYAELGVASDATFDDVSRRYRALAKQLHPDVRPDDPGASARFARVSTAHEVLGDPTRRHDYDVYRRALLGASDTPREPRFRSTATTSAATSDLAPEPPPPPPVRAKGGLFGFFGEFAANHPFALGIVVLMVLILVVTGLSGATHHSDGTGTRDPVTSTFSPGGPVYRIVPGTVTTIAVGTVTVRFVLDGQPRSVTLPDAAATSRRVGESISVLFSAQQNEAVGLLGTAAIPNR